MKLQCKMDPYLQDFNFCIFWWSWHHTIIFCWNFDWDPKSNLGPALEQCDKGILSHLEDVCGQIVVQEEGPVGEEEWSIVEDVPAEEHLPDRDELLEDS